MFLDEAVITVSAGAGGPGMVGWRREKYVPFGGPDGGDGGRGGNVFITANNNTDTLSDFRSRKHFQAKDGEGGGGKNMHGHDGEALFLAVPPGTVITNELNEILADLREHGDQVVIAIGGRGGFGNAHFKNSIRQKPEFAEKGEPGEVKKVKLELKLVADVGIIGYPSVGKSTLISVVSAAKPKIAAYHFTTLVPNLGVVNVAERSFVICDIPGLIEGASEGKGLGGTFLKHIERCGALVHLLDLERAFVDGEIDYHKLVDDYRAIRKELHAYSPTLDDKREIVVLNKSDLAPESVDELVATLQEHDVPVSTAISAATTKGTEALMKMLLPIILEERQKRKAMEEEDDGRLPVLTPHIDSDRMGTYKLVKNNDGSILITGKRLEQFTKMTDFGNDGGIHRFRDVVDRIGLLKAIRRERGESEAPVYIGTTKIDQYI